MKCILSDVAVGEHKNAKDRRYVESFVDCPLFDGRQICYWCCLHIHDISEPLRRTDNIIAHPEYSSVPSMCSRDWDEIWTVCSKCSHTA